jgi:hypothetical protein
MTETNGVDVLILSNGQKVSASYVEHLIQGIAEGKQFYSGENPIPATLTCSEVVERLATECVMTCHGLGAFDRELAAQILHSWRERRVQELEEALRSILDRFPDDDTIDALEPDTGPNTRLFGFFQRGPIPNGIEIKKWRKLLAKTEWREQIRKGAKHDSGS